MLLGELKDIWWSTGQAKQFSAKGKAKKNLVLIRMPV